MATDAPTAILAQVNGFCARMKSCRVKREDLMRDVRHPRRLAFTAIDLLTTIAALVILLGIAVSLARYVRASSADDLSKDILRRLDEAMARYVRQNNGQPPIAPLLIAPDQTTIDEGALDRQALVNNQFVLRLLKSFHVFSEDQFKNLPVSYYDGLTARDAWGSPIVFMPREHAAIGMAAKGWFFFSAGPDREYGTKQDNLYSYELPGVAAGP